MQKKGRSLSEAPYFQGVSLAKVTGLLWDIPGSSPRRRLRIGFSREEPHAVTDVWLSGKPPSLLKPVSRPMYRKERPVQETPCLELLQFVSSLT